MPSRPFIDQTTETIDVAQVLLEARALALLIGLFVAGALVPLLVVFFIGGPLGAVFTLIAQFILAVGSGIVLMYVITRAIQLAEK